MTRWFLNWLLAYWIDIKFEISEKPVYHCQIFFSNTNEKQVQSVKTIILQSSINTNKLALLEPRQQESPKFTIFQCQDQIPCRREADTKQYKPRVNLCTMLCCCCMIMVWWWGLAVTSLRILFLFKKGPLQSSITSCGSIFFKKLLLIIFIICLKANE